MKNKIIIACIFLNLTMCQSIIAQSQTQFPDNSWQIGSNAEWTSLENVENLGGYTYCQLAQVGHCCSPTRSKAIRVSDFNFTIPAAATINGVRVLIKRKQYHNNVNHGDASDYSVKLLLNSLPASADKKKSVVYNDYYETISYGGISNLWGIGSLTPAQVNSTGFGVHFSCKNTNEDWGISISVDFIKIKVYYTNGARLESQESNISLSSEAMHVYPNPVKDNLKFTLNNDATDVTAEIYDMHGQLLLEKNINALYANETMQLETAALPKGIYLLTLISKGSINTKRFVKE